jgi:hypothetical protein
LTPSKEIPGTTNHLRILRVSFGGPKNMGVLLEFFGWAEAAGRYQSEEAGRVTIPSANFHGKA